MDCKVSAVGFMSSLVLYCFGYNPTILWTLSVNCIYVAHGCLLLEGVNLLLRCSPMLTQASAGNLLERPPTGAHLVALLLICSLLLPSSPLHFCTFALLHFTPGRAHLLSVHLSCTAFLLCTLHWAVSTADHLHFNLNSTLCVRQAGLPCPGGDDKAVQQQQQVVYVICPF